VCRWHAARTHAVTEVTGLSVATGTAWTHGTQPTTSGATITGVTPEIESSTSSFTGSMGTESTVSYETGSTMEEWSTGTWTTEAPTAATETTEYLTGSTEMIATATYKTEGYWMTMQSQTPFVGSETS